MTVNLRFYDNNVMTKKRKYSLSVKKQESEKGWMKGGFMAV